MAHPFDGIAEKLKRADEHIQQLTSEINRFINEEPNAIIVDCDISETAALPSHRKFSTRINSSVDESTREKNTVRQSRVALSPSPIAGHRRRSRRGEIEVSEPGLAIGPVGEGPRFTRHAIDVVEAVFDDVEIAEHQVVDHLDGRSTALRQCWERRSGRQSPPW